MMRPTSQPSLGEGERVILRQQGGYLSRRSWKLGHFYLTNKRLLFRQVKRLILDIPLERITAVGFLKKPFILATKTCMVLFYRDAASGRPGEATIITAHLGSWCERITELVSEKGIELKVEQAQAEDALAQARRERVTEILDEIHAGKRTIPGRQGADRARRRGGAERARGVARSPGERVRLRELLAELEQEEGAEASRSVARLGTRKKAGLDKARRDRAEGRKIAPGKGQEVTKARLDRQRDRALASMGGDGRTRHSEDATPWASDVAQARRDRVKEILAEIHGDLPERIEEEHVTEVAEALDAASGEIIRYLWESRHAKIEQLRQLVGESSHMNVLARIKETINPMARKMLGRPLLVFERSRMDQVTGENVVYSWWLSKEAERPQAMKKTLVDLFDEGDHVVITMELTRVREEEIQVEVEGEKLIVKADAPGHKYCEAISLPSGVDAEHLVSRYNNNVLQVRFEKARQAEPLGGAS